MFYILESEEQLGRLEDMCRGTSCFLDIITTNDNFHPGLSGLVAAYIRPLQEQCGFIIPICHDEGISVPKERVSSILKGLKYIYVLNKKAGLYHFKLGANVQDLTLKHIMNTGNKVEANCTISTYNWYYNRYGGLENLNQIIPLPKLYEKSEELFSQVRDIIEEEEPSGYSFYNEYATKAYFMVEQAGLRVDVHEFVSKFKPSNPDFSIKGERVMNSYNLYNITSRPTNSFNSVNFLAIPKGEEYRRCFKPSNDEFVELDYDGYQIRLLSEQLNYPLDPEIKAHKQLAKLYFGTDNVSGQDYAKAKAMNFKLIYGGAVPEEYVHLEFFQRVKEYIETLWKQYISEGYIENPQSKKRFEREVLGEEIKPNVLMNYMIQSLETSRNVMILYNILTYLTKNRKKSKIVLITYDAFLIDYSKSDGEQTLEDIKDIMKKFRTIESPVFPVHESRSQDLNF